MTLADITGDLLWPQLFHAARLALSPGRLLIAFAVVVIIFSLDSALPGPKPGPAQALLNAAQEQITSYLASVFRATTHTPLKPWTYNPEQPVTLTWLSALMALPALVIFVIGGGAISRSVACDYGANVRLRWTESLGFAVGRAWSLAFAQLAPLALIGAIVAIIWLSGFLLQWPVVNLLGGLLYGLGLALGLLAAVLFTIYLAGQMLLAPAVAANGADGFGAIERAYAYVLSHPGRLILYTLIAAAQGILALTIASAIIIGAGSLVSQVTRAPAPPPDALAEIPWHVKRTLTLIEIWNAAIGALLVAYAVSFYFTASTLIYLLMRRMTDGQDAAEIWMPGYIDSTRAKATDRTADHGRS